jgi:PadR family transcriptional regulator, regulatory protein PadR
LKSISKELIGASAIPIILSILRTGDSYGYEIVQKVKGLTDHKIKWREASIYPVLKKMENSGMIKAYWIVNEGERPRKYYSILEEGEKQFEKNKHELELLFSVLGKLWKFST